MFLDFQTGSANIRKERENTTMTTTANKISEIQSAASAFTAQAKSLGLSRVSKKDLVKRVAADLGYSPQYVAAILQDGESEKLTLSDGTKISLRGKAPKGKEEEAKAARAARKAALVEPTSKGKSKKA